MDFVDNEVIWDTILSAVQNKYIVALEDDRNSDSKGNIHSLIDAFETTFSLNRVRVIKVRNNGLINNTSDPNHSKLKNDEIEWQ